MNHRGSYAPIGTITKSNGPNLTDLGMIGGIPGEECAPFVYLKREPAPERLIAIAQPPSAKMARGSRRDAKTVVVRLLPPVQLDNVAGTPIPNVRADTERHD